MNGPRFPKGTPEYAAYEAELTAELAKFAAREAPYDEEPSLTPSQARRLARAAGFGR